MGDKFGMSASGVKALRRKLRTATWRGVFARLSLGKGEKAEFYLSLAYILAPFCRVCDFWDLNETREHKRQHEGAASVLHMKLLPCIHPMITRSVEVLRPNLLRRGPYTFSAGTDWGTHSGNKY